MEVLHVAKKDRCPEEMERRAKIRELLQTSNISSMYLAYFHENLFDEKDTNEHFHEIALFYVVKPIKDWSKKITCNSFVEEDGTKEYLEWLSVDNLSEFTAYPAFFASELKVLHRELKHITEVQNHRV